MWSWWFIKKSRNYRTTKKDTIQKRYFNQKTNLKISEI